MIDDLIGKDLNMFTLIVLAIFAYYIIATVLPIDKIIGKIYPVLGIVECHRCRVWDVYVWKPIPELTLTTCIQKTFHYPVIF
jgi:carbon starvation protein CstA